jgi:hypothetical protein
MARFLFWGFRFSRKFLRTQTLTFFKTQYQDSYNRLKNLIFNIILMFNFILPEQVLFVWKLLLAAEEELHPIPIEEALTIAGRLVRHIPHGGPGRLHHVVAESGRQLLRDDEEHLLYGAQPANQPLLMTIHLNNYQPQMLQYERPEPRRYLIQKRNLILKTKSTKKVFISEISVYLE